MDGVRIREYWSNEVDALVKVYKQFETLVPASSGAGSQHKGEDGRYVEDLVREYLTRFLPKDLEVLTGFILRPAVKTGLKGKERSSENDLSSTQLDIIVYDSSVYPVFQRFGNSVIVPPEGVVAIISVKKHLNDGDISAETKNLYEASVLCRTQFSSSVSDKVRGPYLALIGIGSKITKKRPPTLNWIFKKFSEVYAKYESDMKFDNAIGFIGALNEWSIFKRRPNKDGKEAEYIGFNHVAGESHLGLQFILTGILSTYYDETRRNIYRPGFTAFPSGRAHDINLGTISCSGLR